MAITYILFSKVKNQFYVGSSRVNSKSRINAHNSGKVRSTKSGRRWVEIYVETFDVYTDARKREIFLKSGVGRQWVKNQFGYLKQS
jgi:putative endonuclease